jgi:TRAP-type C4-dicarboxylate transport system permease small subunit
MAVMGILGVASIAFVRNEIEIFGSSGYVTLIFPLFFCLATFRFFIQLLQPPHIVPPARLPGSGSGDS